MRRHTVILGAGATIAAIPNGDKNGKKSSVMNGLIEKLQLQNILDGVKLKLTVTILKIYIQNCTQEQSAKTSRKNWKKDCMIILLLLYCRLSLLYTIC